MNCSLSVLIPTYRRAELLHRCLKSIIDSRVNLLEVVIGDDGGDDKTQKVCDEFSRVLPIVYLPPSERGSSLSLNLIRLISVANGEWVLLLHDDDFLTGEHSKYPHAFTEFCDFYFTDHWIVDSLGRINKKLSVENSIRYGRYHLKSGEQKNAFSLAYNQNVCLDGFYVRTSLVRNILPDPSLGSVADYFWMFRLLNSDARIWYSSRRSFAYSLSNVGLTASGLGMDEIIRGFCALNKYYPEYKKQFRQRISFYTWYAVNQCIRQRKQIKALKYLFFIKFHYCHSLKHQFLMPIQLLWLICTVGIKDWLKAGIRRGSILKG